MNIISLRLEPGQDLKGELEDLLERESISAGFVITCVGSLKRVKLRMAGAKPEEQDIREIVGHFEIVSLVGTLSVDGVHMHMAVSDDKGQVTGGHLKEGCIVHTTAELVVGVDEVMTYRRVLDDQTGFPELVIE